MTERDPATDPLMSLLRTPQDPDARRDGEPLVRFWQRVGGYRPAPWQDGD